MAMRAVPCFGVSFAMAMYGWYGVGTRMGSMLLYALEWTARMAPPDARLVDLLYSEGL
jgi:hypothetical protein